MANTKTINQRVLEAFEKGQELTSKQIATRFGAGNPQSVVQSLRFAGYPIYLNSKKNGDGRRCYISRSFAWYCNRIYDYSIV